MSKAAQLSSKEIKQQLNQFGVEAHISNVPLKYQNNILEAIELLMSKFSGFYTAGIIIREAYLWELMPDNKSIKSWISYAKPVYRHGKLKTVVLLNPIWFRSKKLPQELQRKFKAGEINYFNVTGNICHELGHVLWFELLALRLGVKFGIHLTDEIQKEFKDNINSHYLVSDFLIHACATLSLSYNDNTFIKELSEYAADNTAEAFAESVAEYCTSNNVRPLANEIIRQYFLNYKQYSKNIK